MGALPLVVVEVLEAAGGGSDADCSDLPVYLYRMRPAFFSHDDVDVDERNERNERNEGTRSSPER